MKFIWDNWRKRSKTDCDADCTALCGYKNHWDAHSTLVEKNVNIQITKREATAGELKKQTSFIIVYVQICLWL